MMRIEDLQVWLQQLMADGYIKSYHVTKEPLLASATKTDGGLLTCSAMIADYYREVYCS